MPEKPYLVLDTNIILLDHNHVLNLGRDNIIVLPETVIMELDNKKTNMGELGFQARAFGRLISSGIIMDIEEREVTSREQLVSTKLSIAHIQVDGVQIQITSVVSPQSESDPGLNNDRRIIQIASLYNAFGQTTFMSNDVACRIQAMAKGLTTSDLKEVDKTTFEFTKRVIVSPMVFSTLHNRAIAEVDPDYALENFNYVFICAESAQEKMCIINKGTIDVIGKVTETELRKQSVNPVGHEQLIFSKAIQHPDIDLILCEAKAGTGKTLIALSNALSIIGRNNPYQSIIYVRASIDDVEKSEEVGFLSGNDEKFAVYFHPLMDSLEHIVRSKHKDSKHKGTEFESIVQAKIQELLEKTPITPMTGLGMRGRTFTNAIVIIDEVQGQSKASLQKMLTRIGKDCKVIIIGSQKQIDSPYVTKFNNGLSVLLNETTKPQNLVRLHAVSLSKVVRSPMSDWAENIFTKDNNE